MHKNSQKGAVMFKKLFFCAAVLLLMAGPVSAQSPTAANADFNGDGKVEFGDFLLFTEKFDTRQGDAEYEARYDLDGNGEVAFADFLIFVGFFGQSAPNSPPVAHAGEYQSVDKREMITLNGANSSDLEGQPLTFTWRQVEGPLITLSEPTIARPTFRTDKAGHYVFELVVSDGVASSLPDTAVVDVVTISEKAVFAGGDDAAFTYKAITGDQMVFAAEAGAPQVQVGEVMVNTVEPYFLKKVTRVVSQSTGEVIVETEDAAITDVITEAHIRQTLSFPAAKQAVATSSQLAKVCLDDDALCVALNSIGFEVDEKMVFEIEILEGSEDVFDELVEKIKNNSELLGKIAEVYNMAFDAVRALVSAGWNWVKGHFQDNPSNEGEGILKKLHIHAGATFTANASINVTATKEFKGINEEVKLARHLLDTVVKIGQVGLPITVTPSLGLGVSGEVSVTAAYNTDITIEKWLGIGIKYEDGAFSPSDSSKTGDVLDFDREVQLSGKVDLRVYAFGELDVVLFGKSLIGDFAKANAASAKLRIEPYFGFGVETIIPPPTINWYVSLGIDGTVKITGPFVKFWNLKAEVFTKSWDFTIFEKDLARDSFPLVSPEAEKDREALVALYHATNGSRWRNKNNWGSDEPLGKWDGVTTNAQGRVERLILYSNNLTGPIPASLGDLTDLTLLSLRDNNLTGPIPASLGKLTNLTRLYLYENELTGKIPTELGDLTKLTELSLRDNNLSGAIPAALGNLTNLTTLTLYANNLTESIPAALGNLTRLTVLALSRNQLSGSIPVALGDLTELTTLNLHENELTGSIPTALGRLTNLTTLTLRGNSLCVPVGFPDGVVYNLIEAQNLPNCSPSIIADANLRAVVADSLGKVSGDEITAEEMATLTRLEAPNSDVRDLTGLEHATNLTWLNLGSASVNGAFVNSNAISDLSPLANLTSLNVLGLDGNAISDLSALSGLTNLSALDLNGNSISDISALSGLTSLQSLGLGGNAISDISALSGLTNLTELGLNDNRISDISVLSGLTNLVYLVLYGNNISDLAPLVANTGLGSGDSVDVRRNPLSDTSINIHIRDLRARGVAVFYGAFKPGVEEIERRKAVKLLRLSMLF